MAIVFDNAEATANSGASATLTLSAFTLGGGNDRYVLVFLNCKDGADPAVTTCTFDGVNMTRVGSQIVDNSNLFSDLFFMDDNDLPVAGDYDIVVTYNQAADERTIMATSLTGVVQSAPEANATQKDLTSDTDVDTDITTLTDGAWVVDSCGIPINSSLAPDSPQIERASDQTTTGMTAAMSTEGPVSPAGVTNLGWTLGSASPKNHQLVAVAPVPSAPGSGWWLLEAWKKKNGILRPPGYGKISKPQLAGI